jgi:glycosyltransferase involved in cell wall biosynthesis
MPRVSIVVPNYNHARFLRQRLNSILAQSFQDFELILLDDCSTDDSRAILSRYATDQRVRLEFNQVNSGSTFKQWNKGVGLACGNYVWIAESDDYAEPRLLERLVAKLDGDSAVAFAYCRSWRTSEDGRQHGFADYYLDEFQTAHWEADFCVDGVEECLNYFVLTNPVPNASAVVFRKSTYEGVGGADERFRACGDWKLWAAMALTGKIAYLGEPLNYFRFHEASVSSQSESARIDVAEHLQVVRWVLDRVTVSDARLEAIRERKRRLWIPSLLTLKMPLGVRRLILKNARAIDPHAIPKLVIPAVMAAGGKLRRILFGVRAEQAFSKGAMPRE